MKNLILIVVFLTSNLAFAKKNQGFEAGDNSIGTFKMVITEIGEPVYSPFQMTLTARCQGQRGIVSLIANESVCEFSGYSYNRKTHTLTFTYKTSEPVPGEAQCNAKYVRAYKLKEICTP